MSLKPRLVLSDDEGTRGLPMARPSRYSYSRGPLRTPLLPPWSSTRSEGSIEPVVVLRRAARGIPAHMDRGTTRVRARGGHRRAVTAVRDRGRGPRGCTRSRVGQRKRPGVDRPVSALAWSVTLRVRFRRQPEIEDADGLSDL